MRMPIWWSIAPLSVRISISICSALVFTALMVLCWLEPMFFVMLSGTSVVMYCVYRIVDFYSSYDYLVESKKERMRRDG